MKWFLNMKISVKLLSGFILVALLAGTIGLIGVVNIKTIDASDTELYENMTVPIMLMAEISTAFQRSRVNLRDMIIANDQKTIQDYITRIADRRAEIDKAAKDFEVLIISQKMKDEFKIFTESRAAYRVAVDEVINLAKENKDAEAVAAIAEKSAAGIASRAEQDSIAKIIKMKVADAKAKSDSNTKTANSATIFMISILIGCMTLAVIIGFFISSIINKPLKKAVEMIKEMSLGHFNTRLKLGIKDEIGQMADTMDMFADDLQIQVVGTMKQIAAGDLSAKVVIKDDKDEIGPALVATISAIKELVSDANMLSKAAVEGKLDTRADASKHKGEYAKIVDGVNLTLDSVIGPLNVAAEYVDRISKGDIPAKITDSYNGDFNEIKNNLNTCIDAVNALVADAVMLSKAAVEGKLDTRADASKHGGDFAKIVNGVNQTLDSVIGPLNVAAEYVDRISKGDIPAKITDSYNGDFNEIKNNLNTCIGAVNALVADAVMLSKAAVDGKLDTRADASKHGGDFAKIVDGVNLTLDAVIKPVQEAATVLDEMAAGNLKKRVVGNYQGDHAAIKNALNGTLDALEGYVNEISETLTEMANSNMAVSLTGEYKGDFAPIKEALNLIIESFNQILQDMNNAADQVASGSRQVSDGSQELSQGATEQASAIEQLTSSIGDIATKTKQNAMRANEASELAVTAKERAEQGNSQMQALQKAMEDINLSSTNISKIIKVIDDIAFQTNILALNAAVEAARAGQHGKGFAVVAEEVRNLAARSANAANETTGLIEGSIQKVSAGTTIANGTAKALEQIVAEVTKAATLVGAIAEASNEQANNISQINQGVEQVSQVVQSNSATAEESAAASEELSSQADLLKEMIGQFQLKTKSNSKSSNRLSDDYSSAYSDDSHRDRKNTQKSKSKSKQVIALTSSEFGKY